MSKSYNLYTFQQIIKPRLISCKKHNDKIILSDGDISFERAMELIDMVFSALMKSSVTDARVWNHINNIEKSTLPVYGYASGRDTEKKKTTHMYFPRTFVFRDESGGYPTSWVLSYSVYYTRTFDGVAHRICVYLMLIVKQTFNEHQIRDFNNFEFCAAAAGYKYRLK